MVQKKGAQKGFFYANKNPPALGIAFTKMLAVVTTRESWDVINYIYTYIIYHQLRESVHDCMAV